MVTSIYSILFYFKGGSIGLVTVDWSVAGGTAKRNSDFNGDDATIKFNHGETTKGGYCAC